MTSPWQVNRHLATPLHVIAASLANSANRVRLTCHTESLRQCNLDVSMERLRIELAGRRTLALPKSLDRLRHFAQPHTVSAASAILSAVYSTPGIRWILSLSSIFFLSFTTSMIVCKDWRVMEASG
jgi:hypothetical protein